MTPKYQGQTPYRCGPRLSLSATVSLILFAVFAKPSLLLAASLQYVTVASTLLVFELSQLLSLTSLVDYDV